MTHKPSICLNMIVRNEAHIVGELLDSVAQCIDSWVIVDTGSDDGTQKIIRDYFSARGIPGELHERPWRDFGSNRTEALQLARGRADYVLVMDADDLLVGTPDFSELTADAYSIRYGPAVAFWRRQLFRDGKPWRYHGVLHEHVVCDEPYTDARLEGDYHVESRRLGARSQVPDKYLRDAEILLAEVSRDPTDARSVFYLAQSYYDHGDLRSAWEWYARRAELGGWDEEVHFSLARIADCMNRLGEPWPQVQDAYLRAWESRPTRAEPLWAIAAHYRKNRQWQLGYLFAERAARLPMPHDVLFVKTEVYTIGAIDEQSICAFWIGKQEESFRLCRQLLARDDVPDATRDRIARNRDYAVPTMLRAAESYPGTPARGPVKGRRDAEVTLTVTSGPDREATERTLNSFLNCCTDLDRVGRWLLIDRHLSDADRSWIAERFPFLDVSSVEDGDLSAIRETVGGRFWLHLGRNWQFFAPEALIGRLTAVLEAEPGVYQVGVNLDDADALTGRSAPQSAVRRAPGTGRYVLAPSSSTGPAMYDTARFDRRDDSRCGTATLDEVLAVTRR